MGATIVLGVPYATGVSGTALVLGATGVLETIIAVDAMLATSFTGVTDVSVAAPVLGATGTRLPLAPGCCWCLGCLYCHGFAALAMSLTGSADVMGAAEFSEATLIQVFPVSHVLFLF